MTISLMVAAQNLRAEIVGTPIVLQLDELNAATAAAEASELAAAASEAAAAASEAAADADASAADADASAASASAAAAAASAAGLSSALATDYLVGTATAALANELVVTNTVQTAWDIATANTAKVGLAGGAFGLGDNLINGTLVASVAANALTIAIKTLAGGDPSATDPVLLFFRNATSATGDYVPITLTAATSFVVSSGSAVGTVNTVPFRLWVVDFNDASTARLGVINCRTSTAITPLHEGLLVSSTAEGGAGAADSAGVFYTGAAVTTKAYRILGYMDWESGLATAGTWSAGPTKIQLFGSGIPRPGMPTGRAAFLNLGAGSNTTSASYTDITGATLSITPSSAANIVKTSWQFLMSISAAGAAQNSQGEWQLLRTATQIAVGTVGVASGAGANLQTLSGQATVVIDAPTTASSVTYKLQHRAIISGGASTVTSSSVNGLLEEIMG